MRLQLVAINDIDSAVAAYCAARLCNPGSEMRAEFLAGATETPVVIAYVGGPIGWVASHEWQGMQTLEGFVDPAWRRRGIAKAATHLLLATSYLNPALPLAVFSVNCVALAQGIGFQDVRRYERDATGGWRLATGED